MRDHETNVTKIVAINGSLRAESSNAALLRAGARVCPADVEVTLFRGMGDLPHFNPDLDEEGQDVPAVVAAFRRQLMDCDAIVISTPEYAHGLPGSFKNALDWLVSVGELVGKPVALWNASPSGGTYAQSALVEILRTMNWRVVEEASLMTPFLSRRIAGELDDENALARLRSSLDALRVATHASTP
jgi:chromate reductase, NAD(P)H dehydrogenase (quinone)